MGQLRSALPLATWLTVVRGARDTVPHVLPGVPFAHHVNRGLVTEMCNQEIQLQAVAAIF